MLINNTAISTTLGERLSNLSSHAVSDASTYECVWSGDSGAQWVEIRLFKNHRAIELEGKLSLLARLVVAILPTIRSPPELVLFDEGNESILTLSKRTSSTKVVATWSVATK